MISRTASRLEFPASGLCENSGENSAESVCVNARTPLWRSTSRRDECTHARVALLYGDTESGTPLFISLSVSVESFFSKLLTGGGIKSLARARARVRRFFPSTFLIPRPTFGRFPRNVFQGTKRCAYGTASPPQNSRPIFFQTALCNVTMTDSASFSSFAVFYFRETGVSRNLVLLPVFAMMYVTVGAGLFKAEETFIRNIPGFKWKLPRERCCLLETVVKVF